jgi:hypothetical protein
MPLALVRQTGFGLCRINFDFFNTVSGNAPYFFGDCLILTLKTGVVKGNFFDCQYLGESHGKAGDFFQKSIT